MIILDPSQQVFQRDDELGGSGRDSQTDAKTSANYEDSILLPHET